MISVIVPIFNVEPYLEEAIESVLHQTYTDLEIILVDDGSTDGSGEICDRYQKKDSRIKVIHQENRGLSAARNAGIDICKGEMIAFLDSDDALCKDMLQKMSDAMLKSGADIVECDFASYKGVHYMDPQKIEKKKKCTSPEVNRTGLYQKREAFPMKLYGKITPNVCNKLYNRKIWNSIRFHEGHNFEDLNISLPLLGEAESIYILDEPLVMRRIRSGSITTTHTFENIRDLQLAYIHCFEYIQSHSPEYFDEKDLSFALTERYTTLLGQYYYICSCHRIPEKKKCIALLRKYIFDVKNRIDIRECNWRVQAASFIYSFVPSYISGMIYRIYRPLRGFMLKVTFR
ncbi:MAG: glycosyltransferase family 2 protein [Lachnospiraceae bacterium]|nr:glycosyltransferase family 2 protein [Lachnospiraceae bacterium]